MVSDDIGKGNVTPEQRQAAIQQMVTAARAAAEDVARVRTMIAELHSAAKSQRAHKRTFTDTAKGLGVSLHPDDPQDVAGRDALLGELRTHGADLFGVTVAWGCRHTVLDHGLAEVEGLDAAIGELLRVLDQYQFQETFPQARLAVQGDHDREHFGVRSRDGAA